MTRHRWAFQEPAGVYDPAADGPGARSAAERLLEAFLLVERTDSYSSMRPVNA
jgi:hypothetical protein